MYPERFKSRIAETLKLAACLLICQAAGLIGSLFTRPAIPTWYAGLAKPAFNPPNYVFAPVWTAIYLLMGLALFLVIRKGWKAPGVKKSAGIFGLQLALNALWSAAFFGLRSTFSGLVVSMLSTVS